MSWKSEKQSMKKIKANDYIKIVEWSEKDG